MILAPLLSAGCSSPPQPAEIVLVEAQQKILAKYQVPEYAEKAYPRYVAALNKAKDIFAQEQSKLRWLRNFDRTRKEFVVAYGLGKDAYKKAEQQKRSRAEIVRRDVSILKFKIHALQKLTLITEDGKIARENLVKADLALYEAIELYNQANYNTSLTRIDAAINQTKLAETVVYHVLRRYNNPFQIKQWQQGVENAIKESEKTTDYSIIINKIEGSLDLYQYGRLVKTYQVSIGRNGLQDKVVAGDKATPEGNYHITKKLFHSRFYKALVIDYPNADDIRQFNLKKRRGLIPKSAKIGGMIEIHGGGNTILTDGCIGLDDQDIDELFNLIEVGNTITIVGSISHESSLSQWINTL